MRCPTHGEQTSPFPHTGTRAAPLRSSGSVTPVRAAGTHRLKTCREHCFRPFFHTYQARECEKATYKRPFSFMHVLKCPTPAVRALSIRKNQPAFNRFALISLLYIAAYKSVHRPVIWDSAWKVKNGITGFRINSMAFLYTGNRAYSLGFYPRRPQHGQSVRDKTGMNPSFQPFS